MELLTATMACHHHQSGSSYVPRTVQYGALRGRGNGGMESQEIRLSHVNMSTIPLTLDLLGFAPPGFI